MVPYFSSMEGECFCPCKMFYFGKLAFVFLSQRLQEVQARFLLNRLHGYIVGQGLSETCKLKSLSVHSSSAVWFSTLVIL